MPLGKKFSLLSAWGWAIFFFLLYLIFLLKCSPFQFLDGDDALQAIWALAKQRGIDPFQFPLHGYQSRSGTFALIYLFSFLFREPRISYGILCALSSALILTLLPLYSNLLLSTRPRAIHWLLGFAVLPEIIYAGLYPNASVIGYSFGFLALYLSYQFLKEEKPPRAFIISGGIFAFSLFFSMASSYLAGGFLAQYLFFLRKNKKVFIKILVEVASGAVLFSALMGMMGLTPFSPLKEFEWVAQTFAGFHWRYAVITILGGFSLPVIIVILAGVVLLFLRKQYLALSVGILTFALYFLVMVKMLKTLQHGLAVYLLVSLSVLFLGENLKKTSWRMIYYAFLLAPLVLGIRLYLPEQPHRGPGFSELDPGVALSLEEKDERGWGGFKIWQSPKMKLKGRGIRLALGSGFMLPTIDGGRALGGNLWAWLFDWKDYLESINKATDIILTSGKENLIMGQYPVAGITMYEMVKKGYSLTYFKPHHLYTFKKGDESKKMFLYFNQFSQQTGYKYLNLGNLEKFIDKGIMVVFPSFAYKLEKGTLLIKNYRFQSLGYCCFLISKINPPDNK